MALVAPYVDGKLQTSTTSSESLTNSSNNGSTINSDTFLTLLVAEMQNQDPLEPTSNTEWVSQYATFTQVEQIGEMRDSMDILRANSMIGNEVVMKVTNQTTGEQSYKRGTVDYVIVENGEPLLVIDEEKYKLSDLDSVASKEYFTAYDKYTEFSSKVNALPPLGLIDKSYKDTIGNIRDLYNGLSEYEKNYIDTYAAGDVESYKAYLKKLEQLGITFDDESEDGTKTATLDDILDSFNKRMDALTEKLSKVGTTTVINTSTSGNTTQSAENVSNASETNDTSQKAENDNIASDAEKSDSVSNEQKTDIVSSEQKTDETSNEQNSGEASDTGKTDETSDVAGTDVKSDEQEVESESGGTLNNENVSDSSGQPQDSADQISDSEQTGAQTVI